MPGTGTEISRVKRSKAEAKETYDKMSHWYDVLAGSSEQEFVQLGLEKLAAARGEVILEIGFGTGHALVTLAQAVGDSGRVYGIDISEGMLRVAQERVRQAGLSGSVDLRRGDAAQLPFESEFFDAVFMSLTLELFDTPEIPTVLEECKRVLQSGGRLCVVAMSKKGNHGLMLRLYEWAHEKLTQYIDCRPIFAQKALKEAGLQVVDSELQSMWGLPVEIVTARKD
ncbi:MAG: methyltransferase domain-containing protein [Anaerolineae bacterium]|jgi:demethylmenaquinone methyltransferase/2-methoxy-6-polyprenyl-1,4-benzoquinol methylase